MAKVNLPEDTIAAVITPAGGGAVGVVRLSGPRAVAIADRIFLAKNSRPLAPRKNFSLCYGHVVRGGAAGEVVDEVLVSLMRGPRSYTREDVVEISCHGGSRVLGSILDLVLENGARLAEPGEFTKRAFLNGRIDLAQAEAVLDIIQAKSERALKNSLFQLSGAVSRSAGSLRAGCLDLLAAMEAAINFPEDTLRPDDNSGFLEKIKALIVRIDDLLRRSYQGRVVREGLRVVIYGRPNVGKSSLLNALLKEDRAIVTDIPGTTRDTIEEGVTIKGLAVRLVDTAGILEHRDAIEEQALVRTRRALEDADLVLLVLDGSSALTQEDRALAENIKGKKAVVALNKCDLGQEVDARQVRAWIDAPAVAVCSLDGANIAFLEEAIFKSVFDGQTAAEEGVLVSNRRHIDIFSRARASLQKAEDSLGQGLSLEFAAMDAQRAAEALGELTGEVLPEDVLDAIFSKFCIGK